MGRSDTASLREIGELLAFLRQPDPPRGMREAWNQLPIFRQVLKMAPKVVSRGEIHENVHERDDVDLCACCRSRPAGPTTSGRW